jgi:ribose-phosphate pyrophosphokinase
MNILNLINKEKSDISYEIITFPDGEPHIKLIDLDRKKDVNVICRIANPTDLFILMQVGNILNRQGIIFDIKITYLMSMRMDRVMSFNEAYSLEIIANMINSLNARKVKILEPHSEKTLTLIKRSHKIDDGILLMDYLRVYPDEGAAERYNANPMTDVIFKKKRNLSDGRIISIEPINPDILHKSTKPIMVIDDLCDGGMTFKLIADYLKKEVPDLERNIVVTHMVNPKGIETLSANYDSVTFTNSYKNWENEKLPSNVSVLKV